MRGSQKQETRRSARVATSFLVRVDGIDDQLVSRKGDISATGLYFETNAPVGAVGTVQFLAIASSNRLREIRLMAHLVRAVTLDDVSGRRVYGVAFAFMPASEQATAAVEKFVQYLMLVVDDCEGTAPRLSPRLAALALAEARSDDDAVIRQLSVRHMTLETNWGVAPGQRLRVEIAAPGMSRRVRLEGSAVRITSLGKTDDQPPYEIEVEFQSEVERPPRVSSSSMTFAAVRPEDVALHEAKPPPVALAEDEVSNVLDDLFSALIHPPGVAPPRREHLSGLISRIRLPTLCSLFEMERLTGELTLRREVGAQEERALLYVRDGQIVDLDPLGAGLTPRAQVGRFLAWQEGSFEFAVVPVERADIVGVGTTALLLDLAREADEERAGIGRRDPT